MRHIPKHAVIRAVKSLPLWAKIVTPAVAALALAGGGAVLAAGAGASVSPTTVYTTNGEAGYYAFGDGFSRVHSQTYIRKYAANLSPSDALGNQVCNNDVNYAVQIGLVPNGTSPQTFSVRYAQGSFTSTTTDPCVGNGTLSGSDPLTTSALQSVPVNDTIAFNIKQLSHQRVVVSAQDLTTDTSYWSKVLSVPVSYWTEVGVGLQDGFGGNSLAGPATNELAAMRDVYAVDNSGIEGGLGDSPDWTAVQVNSSGTGSAPALITPNSSLSGSVFKIWAATPVS